MIAHWRARLASKGGAEQDPAWFMNLEADPSVGVQVATRRLSTTAEDWLWRTVRDRSGGQDDVLADEVEVGAGESGA